MDALNLRVLLTSGLLAAGAAKAADLNLQMTDRFDPPSTAAEPSPAPSQARSAGFASSREQRAADYYRQAGDALARSDRAAAERALRAALEVGPDFHSARAALCALLFDQERYDEASGLSQTGLELAPQQSELKQIEARLMSQRGQLSEALQLLRLNAPPLAAEPDYHALLASLYLRAGNGPPAASLYRALLVRAPENSRYWLGLAAAEDVSGHRDEARVAYEKALDQGLDGASLGFAQKRLKDLGE